MEQRMILMFVMVMVMLLKQTTNGINVSSIGLKGNLAHNTVCKEVEEKALMQFYNELFDKKEDLEAFLLNHEGIKNCCNWDGVICDAHGSIVSIQTSNKFNISYYYPLIGKVQSWPIPLGKLQSLKVLEIAGFEFGERPLPPAVGLLPQSLLKLRIWGCGLQDPVPWAALANLSSLTYLDLSYNSLRHSFDQVCNLTSLTHLDLHSNDLEGQFPDCVSLLPHLSYLDLGVNYLEGHFPDCVSLLPHLSYLDLSYFNSLSGSICPSNWNSSSSLTHLDLSVNNIKESHVLFCVSLLPHLSFLDLAFNSLSGYFPLFWNSTSSLIHLALGDNALERSGNQEFIGEICNFTNLQHLGLGGISSRSQTLPACLLSTKLPHLSYLNLHNNQFFGQIPPSWNSSSSQLSFLDLSSNYLDGPFHSILAFSFVHNLEYFWLHENNLSGSIPESLPNLMPKLSSLSLSKNRISGTISQIQWEKLPQLSRLDLSGNRISGTIRQIQWEKLPQLSQLDLDLSGNQISGTISQIQWEKLQQLDSLDLSSNLLSGQIPTGFCSGNPDNLRILRLANNNLNGSIPHNLCHCRSLKALVLHNNHLTGFSMPAGVSNLSYSLHVLDLAHNHLEGSIPMGLQQMYALTVLRLDYNNLSGPLPLSQWNTSQLQVLGLSHNNLSGVISAESLLLLQGFYYKLSRNVEDYETPYTENSNIYAKGQDLQFTYLLQATVSLDLSYNDLHGPIPSQLGCLTGLVFLNLSHNHLSGSIPQKLSNLTQLQSLDLSSNDLEGKIPSDLCRLTFLEFANLSNNQLKGRIPGCPQWCTFNSSSFQGNRDLYSGEQCALPTGGKNTTSAPTLEQQPAAADQHGINEFLLAVVVSVCISFPSTVILTIFWKPLSRPVQILSQKLRATLCG